MELAKFKEEQSPTQTPLEIYNQLAKAKYEKTKSKYLLLNIDELYVNEEITSNDDIIMHLYPLIRRFTQREKIDSFIESMLNTSPCYFYAIIDGFNGLDGIIPDYVTHFLWDSNKSIELDNLVIPASVKHILGTGRNIDCLSFYVDDKNPYIKMEKEIMYQILPDNNNEKFIINRPYIINKKIVTIPEGVKKIGGRCKASNFVLDFCEIEKISLPVTLESIEEESFYGSETLREVEIKGQVSTIGMRAFYDCNSLDKINLPEGLISIEDFAFYQCKSLKEAKFPNTLEEIGGNAYCNCFFLSKVSLNVGIRKIGVGAFYNCYYLKEITIPEGIQTIREHVFHGCTSLKTVHLPNSLKVISSEAFMNCIALETINFPSSLEIIENEAFKDCKSLRKIEIDQDLKELGESAFSGCHSLEQVIFIKRNINRKKGLKCLRNQTFLNCKSLKEISFPSNLEEIEEKAFENCPSLLTITLFKEHLKEKKAKQLKRAENKARKELEQSKKRV